MNPILTIHENGDVTTMWTEAIPLESIGAMKIARASEIEFNNATQLWEVRWTGSDEVVFSNAARSVCVAWEIDTIQAAPPRPKREAMTAEQHNAFPGGRW